MDDSGNKPTLTPIHGGLSGRTERERLAASELPARCLETYDAGEDPSIPMLKAAASIAEARVRPASALQIGELIDRYLKLFPEPRCGWEDYTDVFCNVLDDLPELLIEEGFRNAVKNHGLALYPPVPGNIVEAMPAIWHEWKREHSRLRGLAKLLEAKAKAETDAERRRIEMAEATKLALDLFNAREVNPVAKAGDTSLGRAAERATISRQALAELAARPKIPVPALGGRDAETAAEQGDPGAETPSEGEA